MRSSFYIKGEKRGVCILNATWDSETKVFIGDEIFNEEDPSLCSKITGIVLGGFNPNDHSFDISVEKPLRELKEFEQKEFIVRTNRPPKQIETKDKA